MRPNQLENRLIQFSIDVISLCKQIDKSFAFNFVASIKTASIKQKS